MSYLLGFGERIKKARERRGLSLAEFARRVGCSEEILQTIEGGGWEAPGGILCIVDRAARQLEVEPDILLFADSTLFGARLNQLKLEAFKIMAAIRPTIQLEVVGRVFDYMENEYNDAMVEHESVLAYRNKNAAFRVDQDRVRDLLRRARKELGFA